MKFQCTNCGGGVAKGGRCTSQSCSWSPDFDPTYKRPSWDRVVELARRRLDEMAPVEKATMYEAQRIDFAYGQAKFRNPTLTRDDMQRIADQMDGIVRSDT